jgi:stearoyl-CoA desaturase (Delta-9 desaturase)
MKRVGILSGGMQQGSGALSDAEAISRSIPPSQKLRVYRAEEMNSPWTSAASDTEHGLLG